jgi:hydroxyethylthiazole kinase-like uncharacterized protein yjeF
MAANRQHVAMPIPRRQDPQRIGPGDARWPVFDVAASRAIESDALSTHPPHALMHRAGIAVARLALAVAPHARRVWVACGPGNNGGDGLVAATALHGAGLSVTATLLGDAARLPDDARQALAEATRSGLLVSRDRPDAAPDLAIDALLGLGAARAPAGELADAIARMNGFRVPTLAVDLPSGLHADTGRRLGDACVRATHTLALLTLKPGLFTADGRDHAGQVWLDRLGVADATRPPSAALAGREDFLAALHPRAHASHKGSFGDVTVVGGAAGMTGAALLAARAALSAGAGRVFVDLLDPSGPAVDALHPELMFRTAAWRAAASHLATSTAVCGCGGAAAVREALPALLARSPRLVLDADALNALATDEALRTQLDARTGRGLHTVLTPHPLEAARLLGSDVAAVQANRLQAVRSLAQRHGCVVLLKGSGSLIAAPGQATVINPTGNALLASGGTGDALAGWLGGVWAQFPAASDGHAAAQQAAVATAWLHGRAADVALSRATGRRVLSAGDLILAMSERAAQRGAA